MRNIVLIGLSGSGKTTLGRMVAERFRLPFLDLDEEAERRMGRSIGQIFEEYGESFFRDLETRLIWELLSREGAVIATGGGAVLREENVRALQKNGRIVFLDRPTEDIFTTAELGDRPLLAGAEGRLHEMAERRRPLYLAAADVTLRCPLGLPEAFDGLRAVVQAEIAEDGYYVIGEPIAHTLSPKIHRAAFSLMGISIPYQAAHVPRGGLREWVERVRNTEIRGFNVTSPHKMDILPLLDELEEEAALCGAVNTVVRRGDRLCGYNTDMRGLLASLEEQGYGYRGRRILILGAGGAASGVALKAAREGAEKITILARRPEQAEAVAVRIRDILPASILRTGAMTTRTMQKAAAEADLLIHCTPLGMRGVGEELSSLAFLRALPSGTPVCDLVYHPPETALLRAAAALGHPVQNGLGMLIYQALIADELFLGRELDKRAMYGHIERQLTMGNGGIAVR